MKVRSNRYRDVLRYLEQQLTAAQMVDADPSFVADFKSVLEHLKTFGELPAQPRRKGREHHLLTVDSGFDDLSNIPLEYAERVLDDATTTRRGLENLASQRFSLTRGELSSLSNRAMLVDRLRSLIANERTHEAIGRVASGVREDDTTAALSDARASDDAMSRRPAGLARTVAKQKREDLFEHLRRQTVFLATVDENSRQTRLIGSGVAGDLHGTKVILTAGHVIRDIEDDIKKERLFLSVNGRRGSYRVKSHTRFLRSPGGDRGEDAGLLLLEESDGASYFNFASLDAVVRSSTLLTETPKQGQECFIAGFPQHLARATMTTDMLTGAVETSLASTLFVCVTNVSETDEKHIWLSAGETPVDLVSEEPIDMISLRGMSGGGCWLLEIDHKAKELRLGLLGVHTATQLPRLRETPIIHHLRLLSDVSAGMREKVQRLWPDALR